jgi:hypothetical protein
MIVVHNPSKFEKVETIGPALELKAIPNASKTIHAIRFGRKLNNICDKTLNPAITLP